MYIKFKDIKLKRVLLVVNNKEEKKDVVVALTLHKIFKEKREFSKGRKRIKLSGAAFERF